jgi:hypothetical protein
MGIGSLNSANRALVTTTGIITDEYGNPLKRVKITSAETNKISFSDKKGIYSITSLDREVLIFTKKGFQDHEISTGTYRTTRDVFLYSEIPAQLIVGKIAPKPIEVCEIITGDIIQTIQDEPKIEESDSKRIKITGSVSDAHGIPLSGVKVIIQGTTSGTITDIEGNYSLQTDAHQILSFSYVGYITQEITVSNISNNMDIRLEESDEVLGGMIIVDRID